MHRLVSRTWLFLPNISNSNNRSSLRDGQKKNSQWYITQLPMLFIHVNSLPLDRLRTVKYRNILNCSVMI